jgi:transposase
MTQVMTSSMNGISSSSALEAVLQGARRATEGTASESRPDPEAVAIASRRHFSSSEKRLLLADADRAKERGELGAFLRQKRIYSSMLWSWRRQVEVADRAALAPKRRGPKPDVAARQIKHLNRDNARLQRKLERAELIIEAQKKLCVALGLPTAEETSEDE